MNIDSKRIDAVVDAMAKAACKEYSHRLDISSDTVEDEFLHIEVGMNVLMDDLAKAEAARQAHIDEIERKNREIADRSAMALRELSTPIISVWDGVLTLPIIGMVDTVRGSEMMEQLLSRVAADQAEYVIIDITGVAVVDTRTADSFIRMSEAVRLVGAECFLTGISPAIAQTIAQLGIDTSRIRTLRRLSDALKVVFEQLGVGTGSTAGEELAVTLTYEVRKTAAGNDYVRIDSRGAITREDAQEYFDRLQPSAAWGRLNVLIIATDPTIDVHNEARAIFGSKTLAAREGHTLVVLTSVPLRVLVQFLLRMSGAGKKTHLFGDEAKALAWLEAPAPLVP